MGKVILKIEDIRLKTGISKNKLAQRAEMERTQLNKYLNNEVQLINLNVLARLCDTLNCQVSDIIEYVSEEADS